MIADSEHKQNAKNRGYKHKGDVSHQGHAAKGHETKVYQVDVDKFWSYESHLCWVDYHLYDNESEVKTHHHWNMVP